MRTLTKASATLLLCLTAGIASAQPGGPGPMMAPGPEGAGAPGGDGFPGEPVMLMRFLDRLDLTDSQWEEVQTILEDTRDRIEAIREEMRAEEPLKAFLTAFSEPTLTISDLAALTDEMDSVRTRIRDISLDAVVRIHDLLTEDQLARVGELADSDIPMGPRGGGSGFGPGRGRM
jgi:hypothetical protein